MSSWFSAPAPKTDVDMLEMETREASPSQFLLKVESLSLLGDHKYFDKHETGEFNAGGYKWRLIIKYNGEKSGKNNKYISAYLAISDTTSLPAHWEVNAVFSIFLMNQISGNYHYSSGTRRFIGVKTEWGFSQFISKNVVNDPSNGFLINNECVFGVEVFIVTNSAVCRSLKLKDVSVPHEPYSKISDLSKVGDVWDSKQYAWEACVATKRKGEEISCLELFMLLFDAMTLKPSSVLHLKDHTNDEHQYHNETEVAKLETRDVLPTHFLMKVESFTLLGKHEIHKLKTGEFDAGGYKWRLIICPNEDKSGIDSNYISVYLAISDKTFLKPDNYEVNVVFSIFLFDQISGNYHYSLGRTRRFLAMKTEWGISKFISKKDLTDPSNGFLVDNKCVFGAEVFVVEKSTVFECLSVKKATGPYKRSWKISNFSKLGNVWTSEQFDAGGLTWEVTIYPKGQNNEKGRWLSTYLRLTDSKKRVTAIISICIKNQINQKNSRKKVFDWPSTWSTVRGLGLARAIELGILNDPKNGFIINDSCLLEIEISVQAVVV